MEKFQSDWKTKKKNEKLELFAWNINRATNIDTQKLKIIQRKFVSTFGIKCIFCCLKNDIANTKINLRIMETVLRCTRSRSI